MNKDINDRLEEEIKDDKIHDSKISRCNGLLERFALKKDNNKKVLAQSVTKIDGPFYCYKCLSEVVVRKCTEKVDHFAHYARQSPILTAKNRELHDNCRDILLSHLQDSFPSGNWETERLIQGNKQKGTKDVVPDISGRIDGIPIAIEIQRSPYTINRIFDKMVEYHKRKVAVLYIVPLREELGEEPFRPRLYEKYLHSIYYGRIYYWDNNCNDYLLPVHFSPAVRWIEESTWFDVELGDYRTAGGCWVPYKTIKQPNCGKRIKISIDFVQEIRAQFTPNNVKKIIPESTIYKDKLDKWWNKKEYSNIQEKINNLNPILKSNDFGEYEYLDEYDDE